MISDPRKWSFLAETVADWRAILLLDTAARCGFLGETGTAGQIAVRHGLDVRAVETVLEGLELFGITERDGEGGFSFAEIVDITPTARHHADVIRSWTRLESRVERPLIENRPQRSAGDLARWLEALATNARPRSRDVVATCLAHCPDAASVLDLGGGHGVFAQALRRAGLDTVIQDRPAVIDIIRPEMEASGVEVFAGDFHEVLPDRTFDVVLMSGVAHTMARERLERLYRRLRPLVTDTGALIVMTIIGGPETRRRVFAVQMLSTGNGGGTFGFDEHKRWLAAAGFEQIDVTPADGDDSDLIVARTRRREPSIR